MSTGGIPLQVLKGGYADTRTVGGASGTTINVDPIAAEEEHIMSTVSSILPSLPSPLRLIHGPLPITIDTWSDGAVEARLPSLALAGEGETDTDAIRSLAREIAEFAVEVKSLVDGGESLGGPLLERWNGLLALVDISGLSSQ